jgi:hypothetical protein
LLHHEATLPQMGRNSLPPLYCSEHVPMENTLDAYDNNALDYSLRPFPVAKQLSNQANFQSLPFWSPMKACSNNCSQKLTCFCNRFCHTPCCFKSPCFQYNNIHKPHDFASEKKNTTLWEPLVDCTHPYCVPCENTKNVATQCPLVYEPPACLHSSCYEKSLCQFSQAYHDATYCCQFSSKNHDNTPTPCCHGMHGSKPPIHDTIRSNSLNNLNHFSYPFKPCEKISLSHNSSTKTASSGHSRSTSFSSTPRERFSVKATAFHEPSRSNKESTISQAKKPMIRSMESKKQAQMTSYKKKMINDKPDAKKTFLVKEKLVCPARKTYEKAKYPFPSKVQSVQHFYEEGEPLESKEEYATDPDILSFPSTTFARKETCCAIENTTRHDQEKTHQTCINKNSFGTTLGKNLISFSRKEEKPKNTSCHTVLPSTNAGKVQDEVGETFSKPWEETLRCPESSLLSHEKVKVCRAIKHTQGIRQFNSEENIHIAKSLPVNEMKLFDTDISPCHETTPRSFSCSHEPLTTKKKDVKHLAQSTDCIEIKSTTKKIETKDQVIQTDSVEYEVNTPTFQSRQDAYTVKPTCNENNLSKEKKNVSQNSLQKTPCTETCHLEAKKATETFHVTENKKLWKNSLQKNSHNDSTRVSNPKDSTKTCWNKLHSLLYTSPKKHGNLQPIQRNVTDHFRMRRLPKPLYTKNYEIIPIGPLTESVAKNTALSTKCSLPLPYAVYL